jgi:EpsI family protein
MSSFKLAGPARWGLLLGAALILVVQAGMSRMLKIDEQTIGLPGLHSIPFELGPWQSSAEQPMDAVTMAFLRPDEFISRDYVDAQKGAEVGLFVAFFKSLQNTYGPHSPKICLPGSGWLVTSEKVVHIPVPGRPGGIPANQFTMEKSNQRILVLYWYQNDRDVWAEEYHAKLRLLPDLIRYRRSDVSLVRLVAPMHGFTPENELASSKEFTERIFPLLAEHFASVH